ncbi:hypothetical protein [Endozoicomonas arenosclerae]|uniref:hypothetical protein n=1 Tax=Endozoicomonas arenosclerae TaxID=1633495 RepID=UPI0007821E4C|nr:hypothetical protein [Endozoicomonas arenosclerae]
MQPQDLQLSKNVIDMMMTIRRRVKAEFDERLMLSDVQIVETLESFRARSISEETRLLIGTCLMEMTGSLSGSSSARSPSVEVSSSEPKRKPKEFIEDR